MFEMRHLAIFLSGAAAAGIGAAPAMAQTAADSGHAQTQGQTAGNTAGQPGAVGDSPGSPATASADSGDSKDAIVVTGVRASLRSAQQIKRNATQVVDSIVAEDIGKLPDNTVSDALQRVTGIQVYRGGGEVNSVLVRGLPDLETLISGREVFTGTGRGVALQDIPAELVAGIDVYKTNTPDMIEGSVSGTIDTR
ncbi:MAG: TonB-dependent receptor plug domain-containing protein, partial [Pseudomonadota bacterium]|nr:TonB-dependent receptor plug domain-containing protein [Pseudomonadota bacterium]